MQKSTGNQRTIIGWILSAVTLAIAAFATSVGASGARAMEFNGNAQANPFNPYPGPVRGSLFLPGILQTFASRAPTPVPPAGPLQQPKGDGLHLVGFEIAHGKWHSTGTGDSCYWARYDRDQSIIDNHYGLSGGTVNIQPTDFEVIFEDCGTWEYIENKPIVLQPGAAGPKGDGFYTVGVEILPGIWNSNGTESGCYWARLDEYQDIIRNYYGLSGGAVYVQTTDYEVEFDGCGTWFYMGQ